MDTSTRRTARRLGVGLTGLMLIGSTWAFGAAHATAAATPTCSYSKLSARIAGSEGAAGSQYLTLRFTNRGKAKCALLGHPGVSFVAGDDGHQVGLSAAKAKDKSKVVTLKPGQSAHATLRIVNAQNYPASTCKPTKVRGLRVYPPASTKAFYLKLPTTACAKNIRTMTISSVVKHR